MKMVLFAHCLLTALGEIRICFLAVSPAAGKSITILDIDCGKRLILLHCSSTVLTILGILEHTV